MNSPTPGQPLRITVMVCTFGEGITRTPDLLLPPQDGVDYVVSHQFDDDSCSRLTAHCQQRQDVRYVPLPGRGLSVNRNNALAAATGDIVIVCDDDVRYDPGAFTRVRQAYEAHPDADMVFMPIQTLPGEPPYRDYPTDTFEISRTRQYRPSSIEITFKREPVIAAQLAFDPRFGIGSPHLIGGEETLFIDAARRAGLRQWFVPTPLAQHTFDNTRHKIRGSTAHHMTMGAVLFKLRGLGALPSLARYAVEHGTALHGAGCSRRQFLAESLRGLVYAASTDPMPRKDPKAPQ